MYSSIKPDYSQLSDAGISTTASLDSQISPPAPSCDNFLKLLSNSAIDTSRIWKSGVASVQLLVPTAPAPIVLGWNRSPVASSGMQAPTSKPIRKPKNSYQLFCEEWRPCLKSLTHIMHNGDAYTEERRKILEGIKDDAVREQLASAPADATLSALLGLAWKSLPSEEKQRYENEAEEIMTQFKQDHLNWRELLRSPMLAFGGSVRKRKRSQPQNGNQQQQQRSPQAIHPISKPITASEDSETEMSDDDGEYQDPALVRSAKRRAPATSSKKRVSSTSEEAELASHKSAIGLEPVSIAVTAATKNTIRQSDWAHLYNSLLSANQAMNQFVTGGSA